jgi:hypothetical protein
MTGSSGPTRMTTQRGDAERIAELGMHFVAGRDIRRETVRLARC